MAEGKAGNGVCYSCRNVNVNRVDRSQLARQAERIKVTRVFNFSAGPAALPEEVLEQAMAEVPKLDPKGRIEDFTAEVEIGFDEETAKRECSRCLRCDVKLD